MIGLVDVRYFFGGLVEPLNYKYPLPLINSHTLSSPQVAKILVCVLWVFVSFGTNSEEVLKVSLQEGNVTLVSLFLRRYAA